MVPLFALFACNALLIWDATNSNNAKGGTGVADAGSHLEFLGGTCVVDAVMRS